MKEIGRKGIIELLQKDPQSGLPDKQDTDNPITVEHLEVYFDPEREKQDGNGFCVDNSNGSGGSRFALSAAAAQFIAEELERMKERTPASEP